MVRFPRLLFVTPHAFNHVMGGGITFTNLFRGWPKDRLACVHSDSVPTSDDVCDQYYRIGPEELDIAYPLQLVRRVLRRRRSAGEQTASEGAAAPVTAQEGHARPSGLIEVAQRTLLGSTPPERAKLTPALRDWIGQFRPDILFTLLGSNGMMGLVEGIRRCFDLPVVPHMMDDWPSVAYRDGLVGPWQRRKMRRHLKHFFSVAEVRLGIGSAMCQAFGDRYGHPFVPFQNTLDTARWSAKAKTTMRVRQPAQILYVGSIFANAQLQSLIDCAAAVRDLNRGGEAVRLTIASPEFLVAPHRASLEIDESITIEPPITDDEVFFTRLAEADALLLPVNFDEASIRMIRYSMPTKVPGYLVTGTPVLVYGPPEVAQVSYAADHGWGHVVARRDPAALRAGMREVLQDLDLRTRLSRSARSVAEREHDAVRVRRQFQDALVKAAGMAAAPGAEGTA